MKTLDSEAHLSLTLSILSHIDAGRIMHPDIMGKDNRNFAFETLQTLCISPFG